MKEIPDVLLPAIIAVHLIFFHVRALDICHELGCRDLDLGL